MKNKSIFFMIIGFLAVSSCAKERKVNPVADAGVNRYQKSVLTEPGVWLRKATIVNTSAIGGLGFVGFQTSIMAGQFTFTKDKLKFVKAYNESHNTSMLADVLNTWDIQHSEYRLAESSGTISNSEQEDNYIEWDKKRHFIIDFSKSALPAFELSNNCWKEVTKDLVDKSQQVTTTRISYEVDVTFEFQDDCAVTHVRRFATGQTTHTVRYRVSYIPHKANHEYTPFLYKGEQDPLMRRYGYFNTVVETRNAQKNRVENKFLMNRWSKGKHTIYFAHDFPQEYKWIYADPHFGVIARTNKIFLDSKIDLQFAIEDAPMDVKFGDLGYSFVKFVTEESVGAPLGYGPSDVDPLSGEIIGSNTMIWSSVLKFYLDLMREMINAEDDRQGIETEAKEYSVKSSLFAKMKERLEFVSVDKKWTDTAVALKYNQDLGQFNSKAGDIFSFLLPEYTFGGFSLYSFGKDNISQETEMFNKIKNKVETFKNVAEDHNLKSIMNTLRDTQKEFEESQLEKRFGFNIYQPHTVHSLEEKVEGVDLQLLRGYSEQQVMDNALYRVAIHEFGHNLNLRHNFYGSVDGRNFDKNVAAIDRNGKKIVDVNGQPIMTQVNSSSVMDYQSLTGELKEVWNWGAYDRAALTYAYSDGKIDLGIKNKNNFLYCTDEHRLLNAMCNTWDSGTTPSEVVMSLIANYDNSYNFTNYRFGRAYWNTMGYSYRVFDTMLSLRKFLSMRSETFGFDMETLASNYENKDSVAYAKEIIAKDLDKANFIVASFYDAVIRQSTVERPWSNVYDNWTKALKRQGIAADKIYSTLFLLGDLDIDYSPQFNPEPLSYIDLMGKYIDLGRDVMEQIITDNLTRQVAMEQGFITFGRSLYSQTVRNRLYNKQYNLIANIDLKCASHASFQTLFGYAPDQFPSFTEDGMFMEEQGGRLVSAARGLVAISTTTLKAKVLPKLVISKLVEGNSNVPAWLKQEANIAVVEYAGNYLYASSAANKYAFDILKSVVDSPAEYKESNAQYAFQFYKSILQAKGLNFNGVCQ